MGSGPAPYKAVTGCPGLAGPLLSECAAAAVRVGLV